MKKETVDILKEYNQEHILDYLPILNENEEKNLEEQILNIDFAQLEKIYKEIQNKSNIEEQSIENIPYVDKSKLSKEEEKRLKAIGDKKIQDGKYAVITMAGGQGTRLGHKGPKGSYMVNTINGEKFLFEIIIDGLKKANNDYNVIIPWYIMTSRENEKETMEFFKQHEYFGYDKNKIKFFRQNELPLIDFNGKILMDKDKKIKEASNGNGGIYKALEKNKILQSMQDDGIEWVFVNGIDNILSKFIDPILVGLTIEQNNLIASKSVVKKYPTEKAGVYGKKNGKPVVIEYSELPIEMAEEVDENGELLYGEMNILSHLFNIKALENLAYITLPYHGASKKSGYLKTNGEFADAEEPNVYKFESFIFDAFSIYDDMTILRVKREEEFAPIKNKDGVDSPNTAVKLYNEFYENFNKNGRD